MARLESMMMFQTSPKSVGHVMLVPGRVLPNKSQPVSSLNSTWNDFCRSPWSQNVWDILFFDGSHFWERPLKWCENSYQEKFTKTKKMGSNWPLTNSAIFKQMDVWKMTSTVFFVFCWALKVLRNCVPATSNDSSHQLRRLVTSASASVPSAPASLVSNLR